MVNFVIYCVARIGELLWNFWAKPPRMQMKTASQVDTVLI